MNNPEVYHTPVLLKESVDGMEITADSTCIDVTFGGGGHSRRDAAQQLSGDPGGRVTDLSAENEEYRDDHSAGSGDHYLGYDFHV